ncbi:hypothetical protein NDK50_34525 [Paraburkholderia bryophila]|uniref:hypothetical protein n=1 Tax=Paraburkholderia bryophila TaxID=420952 RepID=UPI002349DD9B|nr:hypothetical protein [Paraburkholderia bryophila]WCM23074.1 hypothetical protein NDK50_34525 [Paraburkholderia bryophila]
MQRPLANHELKLLEFLLTVNEPFYEKYLPRWRAQIETCTVREVNVPYCLAISHEDRLPGGGYTPLARDLIAIDEGVSVLIYAYVIETRSGYVLHSLDIDRLDGEALVKYPEAGDSLMIMEAGKRIGGADLRHVFKESDLPPHGRLP